MILPTSSVTALITSRPSFIQMQFIDQLVILTGFCKETVDSILQSEFMGDFKRIRYLTAQLNNNSLLEDVCSTPLNLAIICNFCRSNDNIIISAKPLPNTMTELYAKLIWTLVLARIKGNGPHKSSLSSDHDLPKELQHLWWQVCELAFINLNGHTQSDDAAINSPELKKISYFGLIKPVAENGDTPSFSFLHPRFEEYLAALHLAQQPQEVQLKFLANTEYKDRNVSTTFWHFFINAVGEVNPDLVVQILRNISTRNVNKQKYIMDLCHLSYETKNDVVNKQVIRAIDIEDNEVLRFGHSHNNLYDCIAMIYVIENVTQECRVEINFQDCHLAPEHIIRLANALHKNSSLMQVRGLNLSGNKLNNSLVIDFFNKLKVATTLKFLKVLILRKCDIGTISDIKAILSALMESHCETLTLFDLSFNTISISFLKVLKCHIEAYATFERLEHLGLKGSLKHDVSTSDLVDFTEVLASKCKYL